MGHDDDHDGPSFPHGQHYHNFNSSIMITAIAALSFVIILVIALHIYARCVLRRHARRRSAVRDLGLAVAHARSTEQPKTGLDPSVIASLPFFQFKKNIDDDYHDHDNSITECAVCLSLLADGEMARALPNCKHTFHAECIDMWFNQHTTCPICRTEAEPRPVPEPREAPAGVAQPTAPPFDRINSSLSCMEGTSSMGCSVQQSGKISGSSSSRLSSFRRMLSRDRSSRRIPIDHGDVQDLERQ